MRKKTLGLIIVHHKQYITETGTLVMNRHATELIISSGYAVVAPHFVAVG